MYNLVAKKGSLDDVGKLEKDKSETYSNVNISQLSDEDKQSWINIITDAFDKLQDATRLCKEEELPTIRVEYSKIKKTF